ncbi:MAG: rhomboid family intramembrane serine protease [Xanthomonadaceae bacterium]|nr:rhomboid family intramembrane serine protease [Xanthomonadaceae bacterium]
MAGGFGSDTIAGLAGRIAALAPVAVRFAWGSGRLEGRGHLGIDGDTLRLTGELAGVGRVDLAAHRSQVTGWQRKRGDQIGLAVRAASGNGQEPLRALAFEREADAERLVAWLPPSASRTSLVRRWYEERLGPYRREAWATYALLGVLVACYALQVASSGRIAFDAAMLLGHGANLPARTLDGEPWRLLAAVFLHADFGHLFGNALTFLALGPYVERLYGRAALPALFVGAGIAGSAVDLFTNFGIVAVGASGAVFGIVGALLAYPLRRPGHLPLASMRVILAFGGLYTAWSLKQGFDNVGVNNSAHVTGLLAGFALGLLLAPPFERERRPAWLPLAAVAALFAVLLASALALGVARRGDDFRLSQVLHDLAARAKDLDSDCEVAARRARDDPAAGRAAFEAACIATLDEIEARITALAPRDEGLRQRVAEQLAVLSLRRTANRAAAARFTDIAALGPADAARSAALDACKAALDGLESIPARQVVRAVRAECVAALDDAIALLDAAATHSADVLRYQHASRTLWRAERSAFERIADAIERADDAAIEQAVADLEAARAAFSAATGVLAGA